MKVAVIGLWHLGCVTAACLANAQHEVIAYDPNEETIQPLLHGHAPIYEPDLDALLTKGKEEGKLHFTSDAKELMAAEIAWITFDTPVDDNDVAQVEWVMRAVEAIFPHLQNHALVLISSQIPVGTTRKLKALSAKSGMFTFACSPENLRLGKAIKVFTHPDRVVVGIETDADKLKN